MNSTNKFGLSDSLIAAVSAIVNEKKLDPVGKADPDIDNDGDVDKSDKYLHNRRKAISKAVGGDKKKTLMGGKDPIEVEPKLKEEVEEVEEREMSPGEMKKREKIVKSMKKNLSGFKQRYGSRGKDVMYATATKMAMKNEEVEETNEAFVNNRTLAAAGKMHPDMAKSMKVGSDVDFYQHGTGDKASGIVKKNDGKTVHIAQHGEDGRMGAGKTHKFTVSEEVSVEEASELPKDVISKAHKIAKALIRKKVAVREPYAVGMATAKKEAGRK